MKYPIKYKNITSSIEYYQEVIEQHQKASSYLSDFLWCKQIINAGLYLNLGSTLCIFLFEIENTSSSDDNYLWVIVGDLPAMYLDVYAVKSTKEVIENYVGLAGDWVENIKAGKSIDDCYPFRAEPTIEIADLLERRISFMKNTLIENIEDIKILI
ncbi:MAG: hypothetical protein V4592_03905 [Bacteroidota bacterium]